MEYPSLTLAAVYFSEDHLSCRPIIYAMPEAAIIFLLFMGIASIVLFNLMTAIVVKNAFDASEADEEMLGMRRISHEWCSI